MPVHFVGQNTVDERHGVLFGLGAVTAVTSGCLRVWLFGSGQNHVYVILAGYGKAVTQYFIHFVHVADASQEFSVHVDYFVVDFDPAVSEKQYTIIRCNPIL